MGPINAGGDITTSGGINANDIGLNDQAIPPTSTPNQYTLYAFVGAPGQPDILAGVDNQGNDYVVDTTPINPFSRMVGC